MNPKLHETLHELVDPSDPLLCYWLNLLHRQFPLNEQDSPGGVLRTVQRKEKGEAANSHLFVALSDGPDGDSVPVGMAQLDFYAQRSVAVLWYMAVDPGREGQGIGSRIMESIKQIAWSEPDCRCIVIETERPEGHTGHETPDERSERFRKIDARNRFYIERHGALQLQGIEYYQKAGFSARVRMDLMLMFDQEFPTPGAEDAFEKCKAIFGKSLTQTEMLALSSTPPDYGS